MKILWLCKRRPQGRDLIRAPHGRFYYLPQLLAKRGHRVSVALLSYAGLPSETAERDGVRWHSDDLASGLAYLRRVRTQVRQEKPDWILGASDTYFGILATHLAAQYGCRSAIDAYDNVESYLPWALPLHALWRRAVQRADLVTAAGPQLAELLAGTGRRERVRVLPMAADPQFREMDKTESRRSLGLEGSARYLGVAGSLDARRGASVLMEAWERVRARDPSVQLLLTGRSGEKYRAHAGVRCLGRLPDETMPAFVNSLDVACVVVADNAFGRYSYPGKLHEAMACGIPVAASATAAVRWILNGDASFLAPVGDAVALADCIAANLQRGRVRYPAAGGWDTRAAELDAWLTASSKTSA